MLLCSGMIIAIVISPRETFFVRRVKNNGPRVSVFIVYTFHRHSFTAQLTYLYYTYTIE